MFFLYLTNWVNPKAVTIALCKLSKSSNRQSKPKLKLCGQCRKALIDIAAHIFSLVRIISQKRVFERKCSMNSKKKIIEYGTMVRLRKFTRHDLSLD